MQCKYCHEKKQRSPEELKTLLNRLNRIEGQIRGLKTMLENDAYCTDIIIQTTAVSSALDGFTKELLASHIRSCVSEDIRQGNAEAVDELVMLVKRLMK